MANSVDVDGTPSFLAHLERDKSGKVVALVASSARIKKLRFERVE